MENKFDFNKNLEFLIDTVIDTSKITDQNKVLSSVDYNKTFLCIEDSLNLLYEKTRTIQNIIDYSNIFIKNEIDETVIECKTLLDSIENNRDLIKDSAYINYNVKLQSIFDTYSDRNNSPIKGVHMHNGVITLNTNSIESIELNSVSMESKNINNNIVNTKDDVTIEKNYRSLYMFDRTQKNPVKEKIIMNLAKVRTVNKINLIPSNCKIDSIEFTDESGSLEIVKGYDINIFKNRNIKSIAINIECSNYMISQVDYNEVKDEDFWDTINNIKNDENLFIDKKKFYYYLFGLDKISIEYVDKSNKSCFVSKDIKIEELKNNEYIAIESNYMCEEGNVEFYIIDGTTEIPIMPESNKYINHEQIFYKIPTIFAVDNINEVKIFKDKVPVKTSLNEAINSTEEGYTISYKPKSATAISTLLNNTIKVKVIIRNYNNNYIPFIKSIKVKKYGGSALWIDNNQM